MRFPTLRCLLVLLCLLHTSCRESIPPRTAKSRPAKLTGSQQPADPAPEPLSVRIDFDSETSGPVIDYEGPIRVVVTNQSDRPVRIWSPDKTRSGYRQFLLHFATPETGKETIARRGGEDNDDYWKSRILDSHSGAEVVEIAAKGEASFETYFPQFEWGNRATGGLPSPNSQQPYSVWVEFANTDASRKGVWTGSIRSEPVAARFIARRLSTPHHYLWNAFAQKAIEMMESDPKWVSRTDENQCTPLHHAARFGPPEAVEWLLAHGADVNACATTALRLSISRMIRPSSV